MKGIFLALAAVMSLNSFAATTTTETFTTNTESKFILGLESRPTFQDSKKNAEAFFTDNNAKLGFEFNKQTWIYYRQDFTTNLFSDASNVSGASLKASDASLRGGVKKLWQDGVWSLDYEGRAYFPTSSFSSDMGMITQIRNYATINYEVTEQVKLFISESPVLNIYGESVDPTFRKPNLENRTYVGATWAPTKDIFLYFPIKMRNQRQNLNGVSSWNNSLWLYPELYYSIDSNFKIGAGLESASFFDANFENFSFENAFQYGKYQLILQASL